MEAPVYSEKRKLWLRPETLDDYVAAESNGYIKAMPPSAGDVLLDVGANIGAVTAAYLRAGARHVIAVEPEPRNVEMFKLNLASEIAADQVTFIEGAVVGDDYPGTSVTLYCNDMKNQGSHTTAPASKKPRRRHIEVPAVPFSTLAHIAHTATLAKVDCEGAEYTFAAELLTLMPPRVRAMTMEMHLGNHRESGIALNAELLRAGWSLTKARGDLERETTRLSVRTYEREVATD